MLLSEKMQFIEKVIKKSKKIIFFITSTSHLCHVKLFYLRQDN